MTAQPVWLPISGSLYCVASSALSHPKSPPPRRASLGAYPFASVHHPQSRPWPFQPAGFCLSPKLPHSQAAPYPASRPGPDKTLQASPDPRLAMSFPSAVFLWVWVQALAHRRGPLRQDCPCPAELAGRSQEGGTCDCSWPFSCTHLLECAAGLAEGRTARVRHAPRLVPTSFARTGTTMYTRDIGPWQVPT